MNWHNQLEHYASRGLRAQQAVDKVISPAAPSSPSAAGGDANEQRAGASDQRRPRSHKGTTLLERIAASENTVWLNGLMTDRDQPVTVRQAAQKRLKAFRRRPRL